MQKATRRWLFVLVSRSIIKLESWVHRNPVDIGRTATSCDADAIMGIHLEKLVDDFRQRQIMNSEHRILLTNNFVRHVAGSCLTDDHSTRGNHALARICLPTNYRGNTDRRMQHHFHTRTRGLLDVHRIQQAADFRQVSIYLGSHNPLRHLLGRHGRRDSRLEILGKLLVIGSHVRFLRLLQ